MVKNKIAILLADSDAVSAATETEKLENCGYAVFTVDTPEKSFKAIKNISGIDLILMTPDFANLNGSPPDVRSILKNNELPVVFLLSGAEEKLSEDVQNTASGFALKGSTKAALNACIKTALKQFETDKRLKTDLAACRNNEDELRSKDEKLTLMVDGVRALLTYIDADLRFVQVNKSYADWYGMTVKEIAGKKISDLLAKDVFERSLPNYRKALNGEAVHFENRTLNKEGKESFVSVSLVPHFQGERVVGFFGSITDITERRRAEEEIKRQLLDKEILLKEIHHRIRNNINAISGILLLQMQSTGSAEAKAALKDSIARIKSICVLYDKLLISDEYEEVSVKTYIESLTDIITGLFSGNFKITIDKHVADFNLDSKNLFSLGIIINELLTNVMKYAFTGKETGLINISLDKVENCITLTINDNGKGLPEGFDINKTTGFGFRLVEMITQQLRGTYTIENCCGTRSVLKFNIPR
ncbi:MAG TPA: histidine kinase dimerization/phosphoacceptor domain -containing protein [Candidatus Wallbacteria bacterium]|nr:histidine kinase dimerization/phosphoacceptor domain -containing protein [Candidatus Wallbacteria bacterium]